jgi:ribosome-binding factor A
MMPILRPRDAVVHDICSPRINVGITVGRETQHNCEVQGVVLDEIGPRLALRYVPELRYSIATGFSSAVR